MRCSVLGLVLFGVLCACGSTPPPLPEPVVVPQAGSRAAPTVAEAPDDPPAPATSEAVSLPRAFAQELLGLTAKMTEQDGVLFRQGHERELSGDLQNARKSWFDLIRTFPASPLTPYAYLAFADAFAAEAERDAPDKWPLARQAYQEVTKYPPPGNAAYAYAWHRLGIAFARGSEFPLALSAQRKAISATAQFPDLPMSREIGLAARREMVVAYSFNGQPNMAVPFFRNVDAEASPGMIIQLGEEYARRKDVIDLVALYAVALPALRTPELCRASAEATRKLAAQNLPDAPLLAKYEPQRLASCPP